MSSEESQELQQNEIHGTNFPMSTTGDNERTQQTRPRTVISVMSHELNDSARDFSTRSDQHQMPSNYSVSYNSSSWDNTSFQQHSHFEEEVELLPLGSLNMQSSPHSNHLAWSSRLPETSGMVCKSLILSGTRANRQLAEAHPYSRGNQTINSARNLTNFIHATRTREAIVNQSLPHNRGIFESTGIFHQQPENIRPINNSQQEEQMQLPSALTVNATSELTNPVLAGTRIYGSQQIDRTNQLSTQAQPVRAALVTTGADSDRLTRPSPVALHQLLQTLTSLPNVYHNEVVEHFRNQHPQLMATHLIRQRNILNANKPNRPNVVTSSQQQVGVPKGNFETLISTLQTRQSTSVGNSCSTTQQSMMTGGTMTIVEQLPSDISASSLGMMQPQNANPLNNLPLGNGSPTSLPGSYSGHAGLFETSSPANSPVNIRQCSGSALFPPSNQKNGTEHDIGNIMSGITDLPVDDPAFRAALQLAAARQSIVQAAASAAAAGATSFSQELNDQTHNIDHMMNVHCRTPLNGRTQMEVLPAMPSANLQLSAPRIPTCSICLDRLVSTLVFPCRHFFCENCAPKIRKCGFCRVVIKARHRVYF